MSIEMKKLVTWVDGGSRGNPGPSAIGIYSVLPDGTTSSYGEFIGTATNNVAEYMALFGAVEQAVRGGYDSLFVYSDSEVMVKQIKGIYQCKDEKLRKIYDRIIQLLPKLKEFHIKHIPREENKEADKLVNEVLDGIVGQSMRKGTRKNSTLRGTVPSVLRLRNVRPSYRQRKRCA
jgi:ribonuclease HI